MAAEQDVGRLGRLIEESAGAGVASVVRLVRVPVIAADHLEPGRPVDIRNGIADRPAPASRGAGIIDPFFPTWVNPGERCWVLLWPEATLEMALLPEAAWLDAWQSLDALC